MVTDTLACTCTEKQQKFEHGLNCDLWLDADFQWGGSFWDHKQGKLRSLSDAAAEDLLDDVIEEIDEDDLILDGGDQLLREAMKDLLERDLDESDEVWLKTAYEYVGEEVLLIFSALTFGADELVEDDINLIEKFSMDVHDGVEQKHLPLFDCWCYTRRKDCKDCGVRLVKVGKSEAYVPNNLRIMRELKMFLGAESYKCRCDATKKVVCYVCGGQRQSSKAELWTYHRFSADPGNGFLGNSYGTGTGGAVGTSTYTQKCRHYGAEVTFPDGTMIWASSSHTRKPEDPHPDFGIYMYDAWPNDILAYKLNWADYGLPKVSVEVVLRAAEHGLAMARKGDIVEIGCMGGHGRTGSLMAIMGLLAGIEDADAAIKWVHKNYCKEAIEGEKQEWFIKFIDALINNKDVPRLPCTYTEHKAMFEKNEPCDCEHWEKDAADIKKAKENAAKHTSNVTHLPGVKTHSSKVQFKGDPIDDDTPVPAIVFGSNGALPCPERRHEILYWRGHDSCDVSGYCKFWAEDTLALDQDPKFSRRQPPLWKKQTDDRSASVPKKEHT